MRCTRTLPLFGLLLAFMLVGQAFGADAAWPAVPLPAKAWRGPGFYLSLPKIITLWLLFLCWVKTTDWYSTDVQELKVMNYVVWSPIIFGAFFGAYVLSWIIPNFWIALILALIAYLAPLLTYVIIRNGKVTNDLRVLTPEHLRYASAFYLNKIGFKIAYEKPDPLEGGPPIKVTPDAEDERTRNVRLLGARQEPVGLLASREYLAEGLENRASSIMLDYTQQNVAMNFQIDGVWIPCEARDRETGDAALVALKLLCGLNPQDRRGRQQGSFNVEYEKRKINVKFLSQGTQTGERAMLQFEESKTRLKTLEELGMRPKMEEQLRELLGADHGFILVAAPPANGLRTAMNVILNSTDRLTREFAALEEASMRYEEVENVPVSIYNAAEGQSPEENLLRLFRTEPNVVVMRDLVTPQMVSMLCRDSVENNRLQISTIRAKDSAEALLRVLSLGVAPAEFAKGITAVICQRLLRKLCDECKEAYAPTPQILQQLGIPEGRVQAFYRPRQPNPDDPKDICEKCKGIGYHGRTAVFELLVIGDMTRKTLATNPKLDALRAAARKDGMASLQEEGVLLVAKGVTSLPELMRALKQ